MFSRYVKFVTGLKNNKRPMLCDLFDEVKNDVLSTTGSNLRVILLETGVSVVPGVTKPSVLGGYYVYEEKGDWQVPLLVSLLEMRDSAWEVVFDEESDEGLELEENDILEMINDICIN